MRNILSKSNYAEACLLGIGLCLFACGENGIELEDIGIAKDSNQDGILSPGEDASLVILLRNAASQTTSGALTGRVTTDSPYVRDLHSEISYFPIPPGEKSVQTNAASSRENRFSLSPSTPPGTEIPFRLSLSEEGAGSHSFNFEVPVQSPPGMLAVRSTTVANDSNGDGVLSPGESASLVIQLRNTGKAKVTSTKGSLTTDSPYVTELESEIAYWAIEAGESAMQSPIHNSGQNRIAIHPSTPPGTELPFTLSLVDEQEQPYTLDFSVSVHRSAGELTLVSASISHDSNQDGVLNPGESASLVIQVENVGTSKIGSTKGFVSTDSPYVIDLHDEISFWALEASEKATQTYAGSSGQNRFTLLPHTPPGTDIAFSVSLADAQGQPHLFDFLIPVYRSAAKLDFHSAEITRDSNGDGVLNPGESASLVIRAKNTGSSKISSLKGFVTTSSPYVSELQDELRFWSLEAGEIATQVFAGSSDQNRFTILPDTPVGTAIVFDVSLSDEQEQAHSFRFSLKVF